MKEETRLWLFNVFAPRRGTKEV